MRPHLVETCLCGLCRAFRIRNYGSPDPIRLLFGDEPIEVNREQYRRINAQLKGICATRTTGALWWKRYYVRLLLVSFKPHLEHILRGGML